MNSFLLTIILGLSLVYIVFGRGLSIIHPAVLFICMFFLNSLVLFFFVPTVPDIRPNTLYMVSTSCVTFLIFSTVSFKHKKNKHNQIEIARYIHYSNLVPFLFIFFDIVVMILYVRALKNMVLMLGGSAGSLLQVMNQYSTFTKFSMEDTSLPSYIKLATEIVIASGFVFGLIQINNFVYRGKKGLDPLLITAIGLSMVLSLLGGSRSGAIRMMVSYVVMLLLFMQQGSRRKSRETIFKIVIIGILIILTFKSVGNMLGRGNERSLIATVFMYIGGPLKNMDLFLNENFERADLIGKMTFANQYRNIANLTGNPKYLYQISVLPYNIINGIDLGNVYTALTSLIYDFGQNLTVAILAVMAMISRWLYGKAQKQIGGKRIFWIFAYSYLTYFILMSGFAEKFFGILLSAYLYRFFLFFIVLYKCATIRISRNELCSQGIHNTIIDDGK